MKAQQIVSLLAFILLFYSCDIQKQATKNKKQSDATEEITTISKRAADTLEFVIPKFNYKDTTIYHINRITGTQGVIRYDKSGVASVECITAELDELKKEIRTWSETEKDKTSEKTENINTTVMLYMMLGFVAIVLGAMFLVVRSFNKNSELIKKALERV